MSSPHRDPNGRFVEGNPGGPGNPAWKNLRVLKSVIVECTSRDDIAAVWEKLKELAIDGNLGAIKYFLDRIMGKPKETVEVEGDSLAALIGTMKEGIRQLESRGVGSGVSFE